MLLYKVSYTYNLLIKYKFIEYLFIHLFVFWLCFLSRPRSSDTLKTMSTFCAQIVVSKHHNPLKRKQNPLEKGLNTGLGQVKQKMNSSMLKGHTNQYARTPNIQDWKKFPRKTTEQLEQLKYGTNFLEK